MVDFWGALWLAAAMTEMAPYPTDQDALDAEYSPSQLVESLDKYLDDYAHMSMESPPGAFNHARLGVNYGPEDRQSLDYFPGETASLVSGALPPLVVFIHGGFWSSLDGSQFRFPAKDFNEANVSYASLSYRLAPDVSVAEIVDDVRTAIHWLASNANELGFDHNRIVLVGHSAGAHLAAMAMTDAELPLLAGVVLVSGVYDLEPVQKSYVNHDARMTEAEARALSPNLLVPQIDCPVHLYVGDIETSEFKRQSQLMYDAWKPHCPRITFEVVALNDHFDILFGLTLPGSRLFRRVMECAAGEREVTDLAAMKALDDADMFAKERTMFRMPEDVIYMDGNSLGALPKEAPARIAEIVEKEWGDGLIRSWGEAGWYQKPLELGDRIGLLIGAAPGQTAVADSISVNLFKLVCAALEVQPGRRRLITEESNFPSDIYVLQGIERFWPGVDLKLIGRDGTLNELLDENTAAVLITGVDFKTGALHDMSAITKQVQAAGALMIWDLAHSAGAVPVELDEVGADMAVGCTYKYLNAGPGAPAFLYVAKRHFGKARNPISGWFGHRDPFAFDTDYHPADDVRQFLAGTPPIVSFGGLEASLDIWEGVSIRHVRAKSMMMGDLFIEMVEDLDPAYGFILASPRDASKRGSQVSFRHPNGLAVMRALIERGVIGDFRDPDIMRFGFTPLTLSYEDVWKAVQILDDIMKTESWRDVDGTRGEEVT